MFKKIKDLMFGDFFIKIGETEWRVKFSGTVERVLPEPDESGYSPLAPSKEFCEMIKQK